MAVTPFQHQILTFMKNNDWTVIQLLICQNRIEGWVFIRKDYGPVVILSHDRHSKNKYCVSQKQYNRYCNWHTKVYVIFDDFKRIKLQDIVINDTNLVPGRGPEHDFNYQVPTDFSKLVSLKEVPW